jgi:AbrB family looped-hinge helix DNA binding protein
MRISSVISSKGQIVIPAELRRKYGLKEGVRVVFEEDDRGRLALQASSFQEVYALQGIGAAFPLDEALEEERRQARSGEDAR